jgi:hypothetical protein
MPRLPRPAKPNDAPAARPLLDILEPAQLALFDDQPGAAVASQGVYIAPEELQILESLLTRLRDAAAAGRAAGSDAINPGDIVQLRPGSDPHWQTSMFLVCKVREDGGISGQILRPHRGGFREAWYTYRPPEVARIGRMPFPEPPLTVRSAGYWPPCPECAKRKPIESETPKDAERQTRPLAMLPPEQQVAGDIAVGTSTTGVATGSEVAAVVAARDRITDTERAYAAGVFDGEGSILIDKPRRGRGYGLRVSLTQKDPTAPTWLHERWNGSLIERTNRHTNRPPVQMWYWRLWTKQAAAFLSEICPYLLKNKPQAELAIEFQSLKYNSRRLSEEVMRTDEEYYERLRALKNIRKPIESEKNAASSQPRQRGKPIESEKRKDAGSQPRRRQADA